MVIINQNSIENTRIFKLLDGFSVKKYEYHTIEEFREQYVFSDYDIFVIDINIDHRKGISLAKYIKEENETAQIIFIGSSLDMISDIYDVDHCYFVAKNQLDHYLPKAFRKAMENIENDYKYLSVRTKSKKITVKTEEIIYIERNQRYAFIYSINQVIRTPKRLDSIIKVVPWYIVRVHNSYIVNIKKVIEMKRENVLLNNGKIIPISRKYQKEVKRTYDMFVNYKII